MDIDELARPLATKVPRFPHISTAILIDYYTVRHLTSRQIGLLTGMSHGAVMKRLHTAGVETRQGTWVQRTCAYCGAHFERGRSLVKGRMQSYCTAECYYASLEKGYQPWRQGCRRARAIVAHYFALQPEHIVHHKDGDNAHNALHNLAVYATQADHMAHHRGRKAQPLWDGELNQTLLPGHAAPAARLFTTVTRRHQRRLTVGANYASPNPEATDPVDGGTA